jgi:hypothetical protein
MSKRNQQPGPYGNCGRCGNPYTREEKEGRRHECPDLAETYQLLAQQAENHRQPTPLIMQPEGMRKFVVTATAFPMASNRPQSYVVEAATALDAHAIVRDHLRDLDEDYPRHSYRVTHYTPPPAGRIVGAYAGFPSAIVERCDECTGTRYPQERHEPHCSLYKATEKGGTE